MTQRDTSKTFDRALMLMAVFAVLTAVLAAIAAFGSGDDEPSTEAEGSETVNASIELSEFAITGDLTIDPGIVTITITNAGTMVHNLVFEDGPRSIDLNPGETVTLEVGELTAGTYTIYCDIPGHRAAGMEAFLVVTGVADGDQSTGGHEDMTPDEMDQMMIDSMLAFPAETEGVGNVPLEPAEIKADGTKVFDLTASVIEWEVAPGEFVDAWAYNGMVPGPWIKLDIGDRVEINVTNETQLATDVHWHGISVPNEMDGVSPYTQDPIRPGETFTYAFEAEGQSIGMYHAHLHGQISVPNGMFAPFTIGETPLPIGQTISGIGGPRGPGGRPGDPDGAQRRRRHRAEPSTASRSRRPALVAEAGDWLVLHYYNEGLQIHPMHQHHVPQLVVAKDGFPLEQPYWVDTSTSAPGERYSVLVSTPTESASGPGTATSSPTPRATTGCSAWSRR